MKAGKGAKASRLRLLALIVLCLGVIAWMHYDVPEKAETIKADPNMVARMCEGRYIYMYKLPARFNRDVVGKCRRLDESGQRCIDLGSWGMGVPYESQNPLYQSTHHWWKTHLQNAEVLFHRRMEQHVCLTHDPAQAHLFYVPFYPGLHLEYVLGRPDAEIDALYDDLARWLKKQPAFHRYGGKDHFVVIGRSTWLFRRSLSEVLIGSNMEEMPEFKGMMKLEVERYAWDQHDAFGLPYPTDFHPISTKQLRRWQAAVRAAKRPYQFACLIPPAAKEPEAATVTRNAVIKQCQSPSASCALLDCSANNCTGEQITDLYMSAQYAVQDGGAGGLRYLVDAMVAGAVPVVLWNRTYAMYDHHFPANPDGFSVYLPYADVPEWTTVPHRLSKVKPARYRSLQLEVVRAIPSLVYVHPLHVLANVRDAVDVAVDHLVARWHDRKRRGDYPLPNTNADKETVAEGEKAASAGSGDTASRTEETKGEGSEAGGNVGSAADARVGDGAVGQSVESNK
eukprot:TRINITY_DN20623_c0_g1_i1.p1 TRINITY_DN20623_c0_g1~~TRINITY_DN20623_c0_g1_i1.p1  ORF type:complete len:510 (+),score=7.95 TRINITY_DN20623_c0_g1_i1:202-1731(+)